jgi:hypothetical protein
LKTSTRKWYWDANASVGYDQVKMQPDLWS